MSLLYRELTLVLPFVYRSKSKFPLHLFSNTYTLVHTHTHTHATYSLLNSLYIVFFPCKSSSRTHRKRDSRYWDAQPPSMGLYCTRLLLCSESIRRAPISLSSLLFFMGMQHTNDVESIAHTTDNSSDTTDVRLWFCFLLLVTLQQGSLISGDSG